MSWKEDLSSKISALSTAEFNYIETKDINRVSEIDLNCSGIYMEATVIFFEIKNWFYMLENQGRRKMAQTYTILNEILSAIAKNSGGFVNDFAPNAFLIVFPGEDDAYPVAIKTAMRIVGAITDTYKNEFVAIGGVEFAMGIHHGHIMGTKTLSDTGMERITWFGKCIYKANRICEECARPFYIGISSSIYHSLGEDLRITYRRILGIKKSVEIWSKVTVRFQNVKKHLYQTNHKLPIDDES